MKIFLVSVLAALSIHSAYAGNRHEGHREWRHEGRHDGHYESRHNGHHESNYGSIGRWIGPALLGGFIGYELARPHATYTQPVYQPPVIVQEEVYTGAAPQPVYNEFVEYYPSCNCYMHILRQTGWR